MNEEKIAQMAALNKSTDAMDLRNLDSMQVQLKKANNYGLKENKEVIFKFLDFSFFQVLLEETAEKT